MKKDNRTDKCLINNAINYLELAKRHNHEEDVIRDVKNAVNQLNLLLNEKYEENYDRILRKKNISS